MRSPTQAGHASCSAGRRQGQHAGISQFLKPQAKHCGAGALLSKQGGQVARVLVFSAVQSAGTPRGGIQRHRGRQAHRASHGGRLHEGGQAGSGACRVGLAGRTRPCTGCPAGDSEGSCSAQPAAGPHDPTAVCTGAAGQVFPGQRDRVAPCICAPSLRCCSKLLRQQRCRLREAGDWARQRSNAWLARLLTEMASQCFRTVNDAPFCPVGCN